jgi:hypothetical protein
MSAFDRLPADYRKLCEQIAKDANLSPQNRRVRALADKITASRRSA